MPQQSRSGGAHSPSPHQSLPRRRRLLCPQLCPRPCAVPARQCQRAPAPAPELDLETLLSSLGLQQALPNFERAGATVGGLRGRAQAEPQALQRELGEMGLKMGERQKMITALLH